MTSPLWIFVSTLELPCAPIYTMLSIIAIISTISPFLQSLASHGKTRATPSVDTSTAVEDRTTKTPIPTSSSSSSTPRSIIQRIHECILYNERYMTISKTRFRDFYIVGLCQTILITIHLISMTMIIIRNTNDDEFRDNVQSNKHCFSSDNIEGIKTNNNNILISNNNPNEEEEEEEEEEEPNNYAYCSNHSLITIIMTEILQCTTTVKQLLASIFIIIIALMSHLLRRWYECTYIHVWNDSLKTEDSSQKKNRHDATNNDDDDDDDNDGDDPICDKLRNSLPPIATTNNNSTEA